ncbi:MAG: 2-methylfumaryl-CoA isomerase [Streptosporangiales bacterium]|nr:2-methylfumaryl-CoA isomerase [Streptosporangiales bacterium]
MAPVAPLAGLRIIEISSFVAAPLGGMTLAQLGAEVIRIDPIGGSADVRRWPIAPSGASMLWAGLNRGKRSVTVDLRSDEGQALIERLVAGSGPEGGIVLTNAVGRPGLGYERLSEVRPDLIHLQIEGRYDGTSAVDYTVNAETGFPLVTGHPGSTTPVNHLLPAWDVACGLYAVAGLLAAERHRGRTGEGRAIRLALGDVALSIAGGLGLLAEAEVGGVERARDGNYLYGSFGRDFATKDGERVMVVGLTGRHFRELGKVTGRAEAFTELERLLGADFRTDGDRYRHREVIAALIEPWFAERTLSEVLGALAETAVLCAPYRSFRSLVTEHRAELASNPLISEIEQPGVGRHLMPGLPLRFGDDAGSGTAPALGGDAAGVLGDLLGMTGGEAEDLASRGVIGRPT